MPTVFSVFDLPHYITTLSKKDQEIFFSIFSLQEEKVPHEYASKEAEKYLQKIFQSPIPLSHRHTLAITNWVLEQEALFSPIRATKPITTKNSSLLPVPDKKSCDFCDPIDRTPADPFGRLETKYSITAANAGPYTGLHSLIIPKNIHNPLKVTEEVFIDRLEVAKTWWQKAHTYNSKASFPSLIWNVQGRAGASVYHPHLQVFLTEKPFHKQEVIYKNMQEYQKDFNKPFFDQFTAILSKLYLAKQYGKITTIANLTPVKDKELLVVSPEGLNRQFLKIWHEKITTYIARLGVYNFNTALMLPPLDNSWDNFPVLARMVDRGQDGKPSDIGAMELFYASVISTDPYSLISYL